MAVHKPQWVLGKGIKLKLAQRQLGARASRARWASLTLTPMVDMFTMLVVFLLANFSATGEVLFIGKDIVLPKAQATAELTRAPVISISGRALSLEGGEIESTDKIARPETAAVPELTARLQEIRKADETLHPGIAFKGVAILQCDQEVPFSVVRKVMYAAAEAGYVDVNYAVLSKRATITLEPN